MSVPTTTGKHASKAVIEPATAIQERKASGLAPSGPVPDGAIICYDAALWQWVGTLPGRVACDSEEKVAGLKRIFEVALQTVAAGCSKI